MRRKRTCTRLSRWKELGILVFAVLSVQVLFAQEGGVPGNCGNGIDDDGDGFVDCYDDECFGNIDCDGFIFGYPSPACSFIPPPGQPFGLSKIWQTDPLVAPMDQRQTPLVADVDNDGIPEVIGKDDNPGRIYIFDGQDGSLEVQINTSTQDVFHDAPAVADVDGDGTGEIFITTSGRRIERYEHTGGARTWQSPVIGYQNNDRRWTLGIADFDEDGIAEIYGGNQIYSSVNGSLLASGGSGNSKGSHGGAPNEPFSVAVDVLDDAACAQCAGLELIAGNQVYSVDIIGGTMSVEITAPAGLNDGFTSIADFDLDGDLDAIVNQGGEVYVWDLQTSTQLGTTTAIPTTTRGGHPNVADFDSDGRPEIGVAGTSLYAVIDDLDLGMPVKWSRPTNDNSQMTGSTVYDFHGDGYFEVIYSDEDSLYIYNGVDGSKLASIYCASGTRTEYPVVADVNADGQVEILCACQDTPAPSNSGSDYITLFRTSDYPWISARRMWNQHNYFEVNINDDLSVPREMQKHHLVSGSNNFLAQSTFRLGDGEPALAAPDAVISLEDLTNDIDFTNCGGFPSTVDVTIRISNQGDWPFPAGMPVTFYDGNPFTEAATVILVDSARSTVDNGSFTDVTYTIPEPLGSYDLYLLINDDGSQLTPIAEATTFVGECDYGNNLSGPYVISGCNIAPLVDLDVDESSGALGADFEAIFTAGDTDLSIADTDASILDTDAVLDRMTITLTNRPNSTNESLSVLGALPGGILVTDAYDNLDGRLVLGGPASLADFEAALAQIVYNNSTPALSIDLADRVVTVVANDGLDDSNVPTATIQVLTAESPKIDLDANDDSGFSGVNFGNTYVEGGNAAVGDADVLITDLDDVNIAEVTFELTNRPDGAQEALSVEGTLPGGIVVSSAYNPATGQLVLSNGASIADYQTAISQVVYSNSSPNPDETIRQVEVFVSDDDARLSNSSLAYISVISVAEPPIVDLDADNSSTIPGNDYAFTFDPSGTNAIVDSDLSITDGDVTTLVSADIQLINKPDGADEGLALSVAGTTLAASAGITIINYNAVSGLLSLTGTASIVDYEQVLGSIEYFNNSGMELEEDRLIDLFVNDGTDNSNTARSTIVSTSSPRAGFGTSLELDGSNDRVAIDNFSYASTTLTEVTVEAWVRTNSENNQVIVSFDRSEYYRLEVNGASAGNGLLGWGVDTNAGTLSLEASTYIADGQWHHVAGVYDNGEGRIYVDGALQGTTTRGLRFGSGSTRFGYVGIGSEATTSAGTTGPNDEFRGEIDEVRIWSVARTSEEIAQSMHSQLTGQEVGLEVYYEFEEGSGTATADRTSNGNDGVLINMNNADWVAGNVTPGLAIDDQAANSGVAYSLTFPTNTFFHRDDDIQSYQATLANGDPLPTWLTFDPLTRNFQGTAASTDAGEVIVRLRAADSNGSYVDDVFRLIVSMSPPTLTTIDPVKNTDQDTQVSITFDEIADESDENDVDGTVEAFVIQAVSTGTLLIGPDAGSATAFASGTNDVIDDANLAYWTPATSFTGTTSAFTVVARDNDNLESATPVNVEVIVNAVNVAPSLTILNAPTIVNSTSPYIVTFEFSEDVVSFEIGDIMVGNGSASNFLSAGGNTYTVDITPNGTGDVTIDVAANVAQDASGLDNTAALQVVTIFDATTPSVDIQGEPGATNSTATYSVTIEFSEDVTGFAFGDINVGNGATSNFATIDANTYRVDITPDGTGDITIDVAGAVAQDAAGNDNTAASQAITIFDNTQPTVDIQGEPTIVNSTGTYFVTIEFSEDVTGFAVGDINVGNGSTSNFTTIDANTYRVDITPDGTGNITIDVAGAVAQDAAGNDNTATSQTITIFDNTQPTVDIQGEPTIVNSTGTYFVTIEFSEDVTGFAFGDINVGNGATSNFTTIDANTYRVDITPDGAGDITIDVAGAVAQDAAGNDNTAASQAITIFDDTQPTVDIQGEPTIVNSTGTYFVTIEFSEDVTGFAAADINVGNGSTSNFTTIDGNTYRVDITPDGTGDITIDVAGAVAQDAAGNDNTAASQAITIFDNAQPTVDIQGEPAIVNSTGTYFVTIEFSEDVTGFAIGDIVVGNGSTSNFTTIDGNTYRVDITPDGAGDITIDVAGAVAQDAAGNDNTAASQAITIFDDTQPTVDIQGEPNIVNTTATYNVTIEFSEDVTGFEIGDIAVGNGLTSNFTTIDANTYRVDITPDGTGDITIDVAGAVAQDAAGNDNTAASQAITIFDDTQPTVDIQGEPTIVNSTGTYFVTIEFSEDVTGFAVGDINVGNGATSNFTTIDANTYRVDIIPDGTGDITIDVAGAVAQDAAGNENTAASQATTIFDNTQPTVDIQGEPTIVNSTGTYFVTIEFSEDVTGFAVGDINVGNGSTSNFTTIDANTYRVDITPDGTGDITIDVAGAVAQDAAGNDNTAASQATTIFDNTQPTVDIQGEPTIVNSTATYTVTIEFSEDVTGFVVGDIAVGNGTTSNFTTIDANTYRVDIIPDGTGDITIDVAGAVAQDAAGNDNTAASQAITIFDNTQPTVDIQGEPSIVNSTGTYFVTIEFSEDVTGFVVGDIAVGNGSTSNFSAVDGNTYTVDVTPDGSGDITIDVAGAVAQDAAGNDNTAASQAITIFDNTQPTVDIQGEPSIVNSTATYSVTIEFSEDVTGFAIGDIVVGNGSTSNFNAVDGNTYTVDITPDGTGDITIDVAGAVAQDAAGNDNTAASQATTIFDNTQPTVDIQGEPSIVNSTGTYFVTIEFSEDVTGFAIGDINVGNGATSNFNAVDGNTYTVDITPDGTGDITIDVAGAVAQDAAGNDNTAASQATTIFDNTQPTVDIQGEPTIVNSTGTYFVTIEFSEDVTGFAIGDINVGNGSTSNFTTIDANTYTVDITPDGTGDITIDVAGAVAQDAAGNDNTAASQATTIFDNIQPTVDIQGEPAIVNSTGTYFVTIEFSEDVTGFAIGDIAVGNGLTSNFNAVDGNTYRVDITPDGTGDITIDVAGAVAQDAAGNDNTAATQAITIFDNTQPTVDIQGEPSIVNSTGTYFVTIEFSEDVTGFAIGDINVGNGATSNFTTIDANTYRVDITPDGSGDITIDVAGAVVQDAAGNDNTAASQATTVFDNTQPTVDIQGEPSIVNSTGTYFVTIEFSEDVTGFAIGDINVGNGSTSNFNAVDGNTYTVDITPDGTGDVTIDVAGAVAQDAAGNDNTAASQAITIFDNTQPTVDIQGEPTIVNSTGTYFVTIEFSEDVTGFAVGDINVGNGSTSNFTTIDANTYRVDITPDGTGDITIDVVGAVAQDAAGNDNTAASQATTIFDNTQPTVDIQGEPSIVNSTATYTTTIEFSEDVTGFAVGDINVGNGATSNFTTTDANTYRVDITPDGTGDITIDVAGAVAQDAAGNDNTAASQAITIFDNIQPTVDIQGEPSIMNSTATYSVTIEFSEDVTGFAIGDIVVGNGATSNFNAVDGNTYTVDITPNGTGNITIDVAGAAAQDAAGNDNTAASQAITIFDNTQPTVDIQGEPAIVNSTATYSVTIEFSEDVTGFAVGDIAVGNGSTSNFSAVDGNTYTVDVTPDGSGDITIDVAGAVAQDAAGNDNTAASQATTIFDNTQPTVDIQGEPSIVNSTGTYFVTIEFSEDVTGFAIGDINVGNGSTSNFSAVDGNTYRVDITPDGTGDITIDVAGAVAQDAAGNDNTAASQAITIFDNTQPTVDIQGEPTIVNSTATYTVTIEFSEDVTGFAIGDIVVGNGATSNFTNLDANTYRVDITPDGTGDITIDVAGAVAQDAAGNDNTAASQATTIFDNTQPTVDIQGEPTIVNSTATYTVTIEFSEDVTGFVVGDIAVGNGTTSNFTTIDANTYRVDIIPDGTGDITIDVAGAVAQDAAGNNNTAASQATTIFDNTQPTVDIQGEPTIVNSTGTYFVTIEFSEDVTGFAVGDINVGNGLTSNFNAVDGNTYRVDITPDGTGDITIDVAGAVAQDAAGNDNTAASQAITIFDNIPPSTPTVTAQTTNDPTPVISGTADAGTTVTVAVGGATYTTTADGSGTWSIDTGNDTPTSGSFNPDVNGTNEVAVTSTDDAGNSSSDAGTNELTIDTTAPSTPTVTAQTTNDPTPVITGTADAGTTITVTVGGATYTTTADGSGTWSIDTENDTPTSGSFNPDVNGTNEVAVTSTDDAGNSSSDAGTDELTIDTTAPSTPTATAQTTNDPTPVITGTADAGTTVTVTVGGATYTTTADGSGTWSIDTENDTPTSGSFNPDVNGTNEVAVTSTDDAGNSSSDAGTDELTIDTTAPSTPTVTAQTTNDPTPVITGTADVGTTIRVTVGGATYTTTADGSGTWSIDTENDTPTSGSFNPDLNGTNEVAVTSTDDAGNSSSDSGTNELTIDTTAPSTPTVTAQTTNDPTPLLTGTADEGTTITVAVGGATYTTTADGSGTWSIDTGNDTPTSGSFNPDVNGTNEVTVTSTDNAGNSISDAGTNELTINVNADSDEDGTLDSDEIGTDPSNPRDTDGDGIPDYLDPDDDNDGIPTRLEDLDGDGDPRNDDTDGDGVPNYLDSDDDGDGIDTADEDNNNDGDFSNDDQDNDDLSDYLDDTDNGLDTDGDGIADADELGSDPFNPRDSDGDGTPDFQDVDDDNDGVPTSDEDLDEDNNPGNDDTDGDGIPNYLDEDDDNDGTPTVEEDANSDSDPQNDDSDGDGLPDYLDTDQVVIDSDGDGTPDAEEIGSDPNNPTDSDGDGVPDYLDDDDDNDGVPSSEEDANGDGDLNNDDSDSDGIPDYLDPIDNQLDSDGDGTPDFEEVGDDVSNPVDTDNDGTPDYLDADDDNDGIPSLLEDLNGDGDPSNDDSDGDGVADYLDIDDDNDGIPTIGEDLDQDGDLRNDDTDGDGVPNYLDEDDDNDGISTLIEDINANGDPRDDDSDGDGVPDYLDATRGPESIVVKPGFSPDGDGINDFFLIQGIEQYPNNHVKIFNRWGNPVFEIRGYDNATNVWSSEASLGLILGDKRVPDGTYFYLIDLGNGTKPLSGYVVIRRSSN